MSATLTRIAWAVAHPRTRPCPASGWTVAPGAVDAAGRHPCPHCPEVDVAVTTVTAGIRLHPHREKNRG